MKPVEEGKGSQKTPKAWWMVRGHLLRVFSAQKGKKQSRTVANELRKWAPWPEGSDPKDRVEVIHHPVPTCHASDCLKPFLFLQKAPGQFQPQGNFLSLLCCGLTSDKKTGAEGSFASLMNLAEMNRGGLEKGRLRQRGQSQLPGKGG